MNTSHTIIKNRDKIKPLPKILSKDNERHILIVPSLPVEARIVSNGVSKPFSSGQTVGNMKFFGFFELKKGLKNKLHNSFFF